MIHYLFWAAYGVEVQAAHFEEFFEAPLKKMYGLEFKIAKWMDWITEENGKCFLTGKGTCYYHYI